MFGSKKNDDGQSVIDNAVSVFENVKNDLNDGIALCNTEEADINEKIKALEVKKASVLSSRTKAQAVCRNIDSMLG